MEQQILNFNMSRITLILLVLLFFSCSIKEDKIRWITLDPGHFHAALVQKIMYDEIDPEVHVYGPKGTDLEMHLNRITAYNQRASQPTSWKIKVYDKPDFYEHFLTEKSGSVVVLSGNNKKKTTYILDAIKKGFHVYADKPMVIQPQEFQTLEKAFELAEKQNLLIYDIMTERSEITTLLQKELSQEATVFGRLIKGSPKEPAIVKSSVHHYSKKVSGKPLIRPAWFFDTQQQGEGLVDVSAHLVDLTFWECFPEQAIERSDIQLLDAQRWPTAMSLADFKNVTHLDRFPKYLDPNIKNDSLFVFANGAMTYTIKGHHAKVEVLWNFKAPEGTGDTHYSIMRGTKADLEILQTKYENYTPTLFINKKQGFDFDAFQKIMKQLSKKYPGLSFKERSGQIEILIPDQLREGHEAHFAAVTRRFIKYFKKQKLPKWEVTNMLTKYHLTTTALKQAHSLK